MSPVMGRRRFMKKTGLGFSTLLAWTPGEAGRAEGERDVTDLTTIASRRFDLVVVGGTPAGIAMAVRAAREGASVLLANHTQHLGGNAQQWPRGVGLALRG